MLNFKVYIYYNNIQILYMNTLKQFINKNNKKKYNIGLLTILGLLSTYLILYKISKKIHVIDGFGVSDLNKITSSVKKIGDVANTIPKEINDINNKIDKKLVDMGNKIQKQTLDVITTKFKSVFTQIGDILYDGIINPILVLFKGIGEMFVQIFNILMLIGNKIITLPGCIFPYVITEIINMFNAIYKFLIPSFIKYPLSIIYKYTLGIIIGGISQLSGWDITVKRCYGFNIDDEIKSMNNQFKKINDAFMHDFGRIDFSKIKI